MKRNDESYFSVSYERLIRERRKKINTVVLN